MTAATPEPWRAAWMAFRDAAGFDTAADRAPDDELDAQWIAAWTAAAQAAIAAQDARPAPGPDVCECGHYWAHHAFSDDVCAVVDCPCTRPRPEPKAAPELAAAMRESRRYLGALQVARSFLLDPESSGRRRAIAAISKALEGK